MELKERQQKRLQDIIDVNREKSQQKIKQLTEAHAIKKQAAPHEVIDVQMDLSGDEGSDSDGKEEKKQANGDKKEFKNKGAVSSEKMQNKRQYKEARKKIKMKKRQGIMDKQMQ